MTVRIGIVGTGVMAESHAQALADTGADLVGVADPAPDRAANFARRYGVAHAYTLPEHLYDNGSLDAVIITSPSEFHAGQAIAALQAGLHVLTEIPVGVSADEARAVADAAARAGRHAAVAHTLRFCAPYRRARELLAADPAEAAHVVARCLMLRQADTGPGGRPRGWTDDVLWHHGAHTVDAVLWLLGAATATVTGQRGAPWARNGRSMDASLTLGTPRGDLASIALSYHSRIRARDIMIVTESVTLQIDGPTLRSGDEVLVDCGTTDDMERDGVALQDKDFVEAVAKDTRPACTVRDVMPAMEVLGKVAAIG